MQTIISNLLLQRLEAMLVLKDILAHEYLNEKNSTNYINLER